MGCRFVFVTVCISDVTLFMLLLTRVNFIFYNWDEHMIVKDLGANIIGMLTPCCDVFPTCSL